MVMTNQREIAALIRRLLKVPLAAVVPLAGRRDHRALERSSSGPTAGGRSL
jgi:hypothetical protein